LPFYFSRRLMGCWRLLLQCKERHSNNSCLDTEARQLQIQYRFVMKMTINHLNSLPKKVTDSSCLVSSNQD